MIWSLWVRFCIAAGAFMRTEKEAYGRIDLEAFQFHRRIVNTFRRSPFSDASVFFLLIQQTLTLQRVFLMRVHSLSFLMFILM